MTTRLQLEDILIDFARDAQTMTNGDTQGRASVIAEEIMNLISANKVL